MFNKAIVAIDKVIDESGWDEPQTVQNLLRLVFAIIVLDAMRNNGSK